jgi:MtrB/PioB family decaheme-associated outer membrane protein
MKRLLTFTCIAVLLFVSTSYAEDNKPFSGGIFLGGRAISQDHQSGKFNEYNAISPGLFGGGTFVCDSDLYHFAGEAAYLGDDDMYLKLKGGKRGAFKYSLFYNEFPHNLSFKARSIYTSPGSETQTFNGNGTPAGLTNPATWASQSFDYKVRRKDMGGSFDLTMMSPFFFNVEANQLKREGQMPWAGTSGQAGFKTVEFGLPVDNTTTNANAQIGWRNKQFYAALAGGFSKFTNDAEFARFRDPFTTGTQTSFGTAVSGPDNKSWNLRFTGTAKLPLRSVFAVTGGYQNNTSDTTILNSIDASPAAIQALTVNKGSFKGDVEYWNAGATLTSNPWKNLDTRLYYKYLDKKNNNPGIFFSTPAVAGTSPVGSEIFSYQKTNFGAEASYRFLSNLKGILGYDFTDVKRRMQEFEGGESSVEEGTVGFHGNEMRIRDTWDNRLTAQVVYNPLSWVGARLKYQKLYRNTHFTYEAANPGDPADANVVLENNLRRFDIGDKEQDMIKITADLTPFKALDIALEYAYKQDGFKRNVLGFQTQNQNEFIIDASYEWKGIRFFGFFDYDVSKTNQNQRYVNVITGAPTAANPFPNPDPAAAPNVNSFNWKTSLENNNYAYGMGTSIPIIKNKVHFLVQYDFEKNNGIADFTSQTFVASQTVLGINNSNIGIPAWDDYTRQMISAKLKYDYNRDIGFVLGYLYSQFRLNDAQLGPYNYVVSGANTLLSGAYRQNEQSYIANVYYAKVIYRF